MKLIQDDVQYDKAREALLKMAAELDDPLSSMTGEERKRRNLIYDRTAESIREYRRSEMVVVFPGLKEVYEQLGFPYRDFSTTPEIEMEGNSDSPLSSIPVPKEDTVQEPPVKPITPQNEKPKTTVNLSAWLDD